MIPEEQKNILKQAEEKIRSLVEQERWAEAHRACIEILRVDPENIKMIRIKHLIEKKVGKMNRKALMTDLNNLKPLWKEGRYEELVQNLKNLMPYAPDYPLLKKELQRAEEAYGKQLQHQQQDYYKTEIANIKEMVNQKKFQDAIRSAEKLRILRIGEAELKKMIVRLRGDWIDDEIIKNKALLESEKFEDILLFYQGLLRLDRNSLKVKRLIESVKKKYTIFKIQQKREFIYKALEKVRAEIQLKKFDNALDDAKEVLEIDPMNKVALALYKKAKKNARKGIEKELIAQMKVSQKQNKEQYKKDKKSFTKI